GEPGGAARSRPHGVIVAEAVLILVTLKLTVVVPFAFGTTREAIGSEGHIVRAIITSYQTLPVTPNVASKNYRMNPYTGQTKHLPTISGEVGRSSPKGN